MMDTTEAIKQATLKNPKVVIRAFRAMDDLESSERFVDGHQRVLLAHGVRKVTSNNAEWMQNPYAYVILVEDSEGNKVYGGSRIHVSHEDFPLPLEVATGGMDSKVFDVVKREREHGGTSELCGLWNSFEVAGLGIGSFFATRAGVAVAHQLNVKSIFALCSPYTVRWAQRVGCEIIEEVGNKGTFFYPKQDLIATTVLLRDTKTLLAAKPVERRRIFDFVKNPNQVALETPPGKRFQVAIEYRLKIGGG